MNNVEPIYDPGHASALERPYIVKVNGQILRTKQGDKRRFKDSMTAAVAGAKEVDRLRVASPTSAEPK